MYAFVVVLFVAIPSLRDARVEANPIPSTPAPVFDRDLKVKAVERLILSKLGLEQPPVVSEEQLKNVRASMLAMYNLTAKMNERAMADRALRRKVEDHYYSSRTTTVNVKELTLPSCSDTSPCSCKAQSKFYGLDTTNLPSDAAAISKALLQVYYDPQLATKSEEILISAYQLTQTCSPSFGHPKTVLLDVKKVTSDHACFIQFDITSAVKSWVNNCSTYHGVEVEVSAGQCSQTSSFVDAASFSNFLQTNKANTLDVQPVLFLSSLSSMSSTVQRHRRQTLDMEYCESLQPGQPNCCIYDFEIDLKHNLNWDWIIQPKKIHMNQCSGECPSTWAEDGNYTQIINTYNLLNPGGSVAPCCTPKTYEDVEIMYFGGVYPWPVMATLTDMVVTSCVCA